MSIEVMKQALEALENNPYSLAYANAITALRTAIEQAEKQEQPHREGYWCANLTCKKCYSADFRFKHQSTTKESLVVQSTAPVQEPVTWRNAAMRIGEDLCSVGPFGYYDMTAEQWLDWALSVVTVNAPPIIQRAEEAFAAAQQRGWVGLTEAEVDRCWNMTPMDTRNSRHMFAYSIEAKLKEKNK